MAKFGTEVSYSKRVRDNVTKGFASSDFYFQGTGVPYTQRSLLPGHVYTFDYIDPIEDMDVTTISDYLKDPKQKAKEQAAGYYSPEYRIDKPYFDAKPIGLAFGNSTDPSAEYILDLKVMPILDRLQCLEILYRIAVPVLLQSSIDPKTQELRPFSDRIGNSAYVQSFLTFQPNLLANLLGYGVYFWRNKYAKSHIRNVKLVDFDQLVNLGGLTYGNDRYVRFNGTNLAGVQDLYNNYVKNK